MHSQQPWGSHFLLSELELEATSKTFFGTRIYPWSPMSLPLYVCIAAGGFVHDKRGLQSLRHPGRPREDQPSAGGAGAHVGTG